VEKRREGKEVQEHVQMDVGQGQIRVQVGEMPGVGLDQMDLPLPLIMLEIPGRSAHRQLVVLHRYHPFGPQGQGR